MRPGQRPLDPHLAALIDRERSALDRPMDPHMAALEPDGDEYGEMDVDSSDYADDPAAGMDVSQNRPMMEDETMLPGGRMVPLDDLEARGEMTPDLMRKAWPSVAEYQLGRGAEAADERRLRAMRAAPEGSPEQAALLEQLRRMAGR